MPQAPPRFGLLTSPIASLSRAPYRPLINAIVLRMISICVISLRGRYTSKLVVSESSSQTGRIGFPLSFLSVLRNTLLYAWALGFSHLAVTIQRTDPVESKKDLPSYLGKLVPLKE